MSQSSYPPPSIVGIYSGGFYSGLLQPEQDVSGSVLLEVERETYLKDLTDNPLPQDESFYDLQALTERYKKLKQTQKNLTNDINNVNKNINELEASQRTYRIAAADYTNSLLRNGILSKEDFTILEEKIKELQTIQQSFSQKCLKHYKDQALDLNSKFTTTQQTLAAYTEFIKTGVQEMAGPDAKPNMCSVCIESEISHCLVPCGHTFCEGCIKKSGGKKCMTCRSDIQKSIKLYLSL